MNGTVIHINSLNDRQPKDTTHKWTTYFENPIDINVGSSIGLLTAEVPYTCSQFKDSNNTFFVEEGYINSENETIINIYGLQLDDSKFYESVDALIIDLNAEALAHNYPYEFIIMNNKIAVTNLSSHKLRVISSREFETTTEGTIFINGIATEYKQFFNQMMSKLGFYGDYRDAYILPGQGQTAEGVPRLIRTNAFYIEADIVDSHQITPSPYQAPNIIGKVQLSGNFGSLQRFSTEKPVMLPTNDTSIDKINFKILDDDLEEVDLNGCPVSLSLMIF